MCLVCTNSRGAAIDQSRHLYGMESRQRPLSGGVEVPSYAHLVVQLIRGLDVRDEDLALRIVRRHAAHRIRRQARQLTREARLLRGPR